MKKMWIIVLLLCVCFALPAVAEQEKYELDLTVRERINILGLIPQKTSLTQAIIAVDLREKVTITQEELAELAIQDTEPAIPENLENDVPQTFSFTYLEIDMLRKEIQVLSNKKQIPASPIVVKLCQKINDAEVKKEEICELPESIQDGQVVLPRSTDEGTPAPSLPSTK